jgi:hypothetical protein
MKLLRSAWQLVSVRLLSQQIALALLAFALFTAWLRVPDGSVVAVVGSALLALVALALTFGGEAWLLLRLRALPRTPRSIVKGAVALFLAVLLLLPLSALLAHASAGDALRAGYLNSRFPANARNLFSYRHLITLFEQTWASLFWAGAIVFAMAAVAVTVAIKPLQAFGRMLQSLTAWVVLSVATIVGSEATVKLLYWTPGHGLRVETLSVVLRLIAVVLLDAFLLCLSLALLAVLAEQSDERYLPAATDAGTPDFSHPRTVDKP